MNDTREISWPRALVLIVALLVVGAIVITAVAVHGIDGVVVGTGMTICAIVATWYFKPVDASQLIQGGSS